MYENYFVPYPVIETARLTIRMVIKSDADDLYEICRRPESSQFSMWSPHKTLKDTKDFIAFQHSLYRKRKCTFFVIEEKDTGTVIGTCSYVSFDDNYKVAEIGYSILSDLWNNGFATEAADALTGYAFECIGVQRVFARVLPQNEASVQVLLKIGMEFEGIHKKEYYYDGKVSDVEIYAITDDMFFEREGKQNEKNCKI